MLQTGREPRRTTAVFLNNGQQHNKLNERTTINETEKRIIANEKALGVKACCEMTSADEIILRHSAQGECQMNKPFMSNDMKTRKEQKL